MAENNQTQAPAGPRQEAAPGQQPGADEAEKRCNWLDVPRWVCRRPWPVLLFAGLFVLAWMAWDPQSCATCEGISGRPDSKLPLATLIWIALLFAWFIDCFTGDPFENRTKAIEFAYFFMALSFCLVAIMVADIGKARKFGVIEGCVENLSRGNVVPIQCDFPNELRPQPKADKKDDKNASQASQQGTTGAQTASQPASSDAAREKRDFETRLANYRENHNYHYLLNIGGRTDRIDPVKLDCSKPNECPTAVYSVRGGLPVPVYFIVLALIGGAISLAKNVPGIHKRSDVGWQGTAAEPRLTPGEVRELLLFQVLQFVTAPMLAVIAYHAIKPESTGSTVALGFIVGFGSDQIIQTIRSMVKGSQASAAATPLTMGIRGKVVRGDTPIADARVTIDGRPEQARTDAKGDFAFSGLALGTEAYVVKVEAGGQTQTRRVKADEPKTVDVGRIDMTAPPAPRPSSV